MSKRSQFEIMGLVMIVILVSLGLLLLLMFALKKPAIDQTKLAKESQLASNFLNTLLGTTIGCDKRTIKDAIRDCATKPEIDCNGVDICTYAESEMQNIIDNTLNTWKRSYYLKLRIGDAHIGTIGDISDSIRKTPGPCPGAREGKEFPVPIRAGFEFKISLELCG